MKENVQVAGEFELTESQLKTVSGGFWGGDWGGDWGGPWNWGSDRFPGGYFGGYGYPTYPSNQTTHVNTVAQTSTFNAPQNVANIGSYGGPVTGSSATQTQVAINS